MVRRYPHKRFDEIVCYLDTICGLDIICVAYKSQGQPRRLHVECKMSGGGPPFFDDRSIISIKRTGTKDDSLTARMPTLTWAMWHIIKLDRKES